MGWAWMDLGVSRQHRLRRLGRRVRRRFAVDGGTLVYYDHYRSPQHYGAVFSPLVTKNGKPSWTDVTDKIDFPAGLRHGSFLQITEAEYRRVETMQ